MHSCGDLFVDTAGRLCPTISTTEYDSGGWRILGVDPDYKFIVGPINVALAQRIARRMTGEEGPLFDGDGTPAA